MRIILVQNEIEDAIRSYVGNQGIDLGDQELEVDLTAGRGSLGFTATIDITRSSSKLKLVNVEEETPDMEDIPELDDDASLFNKPPADAEAIS